MLLVKNAVHLDSPVDLFIADGKIVTMTPPGHCGQPSDCPETDAAGLRLYPSYIDAHAHLREPGFEYKEDINSGLEAAARGGFGAVMCMANTKPVNDAAAVATFMRARATETHPAGPALYPIAAATVGLAGETLAPMAELKEAGCVAVSNDGKPLASSEITRRIMEYASDLGMIFIDHCEDPTLAKGWLTHEGPISGALGVKGQPALGEAIQAARDVMLAEYLNCPVHIAHVSSALTVDVIAKGKAKGIRVTAETCPHYLLLDESALENYNSQAKVSPPLRALADRDALRDSVKTGVIDILVTDHAPHAAHEKNETLEAAPFGFTGLDLAQSLCFGLTLEGVLAEADLFRLWSAAPGKIFGLPVNEFNPGDPASFFLFDPDATWTVTEKSLYSRSHNTPFLNETLRGRVKAHWINGVRLF